MTCPAAVKGLFLGLAAIAPEKRSGARFSAIPAPMRLGRSLSHARCSFPFGLAAFRRLILRLGGSLHVWHALVHDARLTSYQVWLRLRASCVVLHSLPTIPFLRRGA
jgi:hypothetical protein